MKIRDTVWIGRRTIGLIVVALVVVRMAIISTSRLRYIRHDLHPTRNNTGRATATGSIRRCCRTSKAFGQLFDKGLSYVIGSYVNSIGNTKDYERSLR